MNVKSSILWAFLCFLASFVVACRKHDDELNPSVNPTQTSSETTSLRINNTASSETIALGKALFWDPILSGKRDVACATCHHPANGYADNLDLSIGVNAIGLGTNRHFLSPNTFAFVKRNAQTILNTAFNGIDASGNVNSATAPMFWDSRVRSLETQSLEPIKTLEEMRGNAYSEAVALDSVVARLKRIPQYQQLFQTAFGNTQSITANNMGIAIAAFERTLVANNSRVDRYKAGETSALTPLEIRGMNAFQTVGCANCHSGNMFSDYQLHVLSVPDNAKNAQSDAGANNTYAFRTPSLRNLRVTAPYMHSGVFQTLDDVVRFYGRIAGGNSQNRNVTVRQIDQRVRNIRIGNNQAAIVAFINALSDDNFDKTVPTSVPSRLAVGGNIK
ncbi:cytochrome c peroxidase [Emticicia sediminis]